MELIIGDNVMFEYTILFLKGINKGHQLNLSVPLTEMEESGLDWYLIQNDYLEEIIPYEEYYRIIDRRITFQ